MFNLPDEMKTKISEKLMIQASAKYVNLGIKLKTLLCNRPNDILPKGKVWSFRNEYKVNIAGDNTVYDH